MCKLGEPQPAKPESKYWIYVFCVAPKSWHFYAAEQAPCLFIVGLMWRSRVIAHLNCNRQECQCQKFIRNSNILMWFGWKRATMEKTSKFWNTDKCTNISFLKFSMPFFSSGNEMSGKLSKWYFTVTHKVTWLKKLLIKGHTWTPLTMFPISIVNTPITCISKPQNRSQHPFIIFKGTGMVYTKFRECICRVLTNFPTLNTACNNNK